MQEILLLFQSNPLYIIPMEILVSLSRIQNTFYQVDEKIKGAFLAAMVKEHRKFKEVSSMRNCKKVAQR